MARTNLRTTKVAPAVVELLTLHVLGRTQISPTFARITLGSGDIERFNPMGFDQWFRLFLPVAEGSLDRAPNKLDTVSLLRFLAVSKGVRPILRNYSVRAYRPAAVGVSAEIDVDVVLHGSPADGTAGPASAWAQTCEVGDPVGILDEGIGFNPAPGIDSVVLVADETGLPAAASILASLPAHATGYALLEIPVASDAQELDAPAGVDIQWLPRGDSGLAIGRAALDAVIALPLPDAPTYGWVVGEQSLVSTTRRHWVSAGLPKENIMFCGYWRAKR